MNVCATIWALNSDTWQTLIRALKFLFCANAILTFSLMNIFNVNVGAMDLLHLCPFHISKKYFWVQDTGP